MHDTEALTETQEGRSRGIQVEHKKVCAVAAVSHLYARSTCGMRKRDVGKRAHKYFTTKYGTCQLTA